MHIRKVSSILVVIFLVILAVAFSKYRQNKQSPPVAPVSTQISKADAMDPLSQKQKDAAQALKDIEVHGDVGVSSTTTTSTTMPMAPPKKETTLLSPSETVVNYNKEWLNMEKAVLTQNEFSTRISALHLAIKSLQQRTRQMTEANLDLKISSELMISVLKTFPQNAVKAKCSDYLRKVFFEYDPNSFNADQFNESWIYNSPEEPSVKRAYLFMVKVCS